MIHCDRVIVEREGQMVIDRVSLSIAHGEALALIGRAGAGKSSLLAALATAMPIRGGDITVGGRSARHEPAAVRPLVGYVPPLLAAPPGVRAEEFLGLFAAAAGLAGAACRTSVERGLAAAGLSGRGGERIDRLPEPTWKLLLVARALLHSPDVLVLDDPFAGLDPVGRRWLERLLDDMRLAGRTVVAAIDDARVPDCFTSLAVLLEGRLHAHGPVDPDTIAPGRAWRHRILCHGMAEKAAAVASRLSAGVSPVDAHAFDCLLPTAGTAVAQLVSRLVAAGIGVTGVGIHPPWTEQLVAD